MLSFRFLSLSALLLVLSVGAEQISKPFSKNKSLSPLESFSQDFEFFRYPLGDFSYKVAKSLLGMNVGYEGSSENWNCYLEFGVPSTNFVEWIHPVSLACQLEGEEHIWPLGEGIFRRAYTKHRVLLQGQVAERLANILEKFEDSADVESPMSSRTIAWGPSQLLKISTLRRSNESADLHFSLECYRDVNSQKLQSCALQSSD